MVASNYIFDSQLRFRKNTLVEVLSLLFVHIGHFVFNCLRQVKIQIFFRIACPGFDLILQFGACAVENDHSID